MMGKVLLAPVSVILARVIVEIAETVSAAKDVLIEREKFRELAGYLAKMRPLLLELQQKNVKDSAPLKDALAALEREMKRSQVLVADCSSKSRFYLLVSCRRIIGQIEDITRQIGHCLSLIPMAAMNLSIETRQLAADLCKEMQNAQFKASVAEEQIIQKIEIGIKAQRVDSEFSNELLLQIAKVVGASVSPNSLKRELMQFKRQVEELSLDKKRAEAFQLAQIIGILEIGDAATCTSESELIYHKRKNAGGGHALPALLSFLCPITQDLMEEPVEIASGQTFERSAILKWFGAGNRTCPTTKAELQSLEVRPNLALQNSIQEWKERNTVIAIAAARPRLLSDSHNEVQSALSELLRTSEEKRIHKYWITSERLLAEIVKLLQSSNRDTRKKSLELLCSLATVDENKEEIANEGALPHVVRSLSRDVGESRQAVGLLLELSNSQRILPELGKVQSCIFLLVTMLRSEDNTAVDNARQLLTSLSKFDENVVQMAEANHFQPLVARLDQGSMDTRVLMVNTLARLNLSDESKMTLSKEGAIDLLVKMLSSGKFEYESAALGALDKLSSVSKNAEDMIAAGIIPPLLKLLFAISSTVMVLKEQAASTLANIASRELKLDSRAAESLLGEDPLSQILTLVHLCGPVVQWHLLRALTSLCVRETGPVVRNLLRRAEAMQFLIHLAQEEERTPEVKAEVWKLVYCLSGDGAGKELASYLTRPLLDTMVKLLSGFQNDEARAAALGVLGNLPRPDPEVMGLLSEAQVLPALGVLLSSRNVTKRHKCILENAASALLLFTNPSSLEVQNQVASCDVIPDLVELLTSGTPLTKSRAAIALGQLSENSGKLSTSNPTAGGCWCFFKAPQSGCVVHGGQCSVKGSFCLVQAGAVEPLVQMLADQNLAVPEAALGTLTTLLYDDTWENGVHVIAKFQGVGPVVRLLTTGSCGAKEKAVWMLEKIFRVDYYKEQYGSAAQMPLIDLTQKASDSTRQLAAKILAHLNILHNQSSYF